MRILFVHEVDWLRKVAFEIHHLSELFSLEGHEVYAMDCRDASLSNLIDASRTRTLEHFRRVYDNASITLVRPANISFPLLNRITTAIHFSRILDLIIRKFGIEIIFLYSAPTNGLQTIRVARKSGIPVIFRSIDVLHGLVNPILRPFVKRSEQSVYRDSDKILAVTSLMADYVGFMGASKEKVSVLPPGVDPDIFYPKMKDAELATSLSIGQSDKVIAYVGTLYHFSGLHLVIENLSKIKREIPNVKLLIVGGGPALDSLQKLCQKRLLEQQVIFTGFVPYRDVPRYINLADLCINLFEINYVTDRIVPVKLMEYLACGKPVISTALKGAIEILPNSSSEVIYVDKINFASSITNLLKDPHTMQEIGQKGREYVLRNFSWKIIASRILEIAKNLK